MHGNVDTTTASPSPADSALIALARVAMADGSASPNGWPQLDLGDPLQREFGDYELIEEIGRGGMGVVYRAHQRSLDRLVAIKFIASGLVDSLHVSRFLSEARAAARLMHPNIVPVHEVGSIDGVHYFSMPLVEGRSLADQLQHGPLDAHAAVKLMRELCDAIGYAHRLGLLHLDLKPANVLLGERGEPLVADFGLARRLDKNGGVDAQEVSGTPSFMAPEQILIKQYRLTPATDIYALGAILYRCLTGISPHGEGSADDVMRRATANRIAPPRTLNRRIPHDLGAICMKCLELQPSDRYRSVAALAEDLRRFVDGQPVAARPLNPPQRLTRWIERNQGEAGAFALLLALLVAISVNLRDKERARAEVDAQRVVAEAARIEAEAQRDRAEGTSALGAWLYTQSPHAKGSRENYEATVKMLEWMRARYPGDEARQAAVLTSFARALGDDDPSLIEHLLLPVVEIMGGTYRQRAIDALIAGNEPDRYVLAARLAWFDERLDADPRQFRALLDQAIAAQPGSAEVWELAATYCTGPEGHSTCQHPEAITRLLNVDPDNAYSWLRRFMETDGEIARQALREAAAHERFDDHYRTTVGAYFKAIEKSRAAAPELLAGPARILAPDVPPEFLIAAQETGSFPITAYAAFAQRCNPATGYFRTDDRDAWADCVTVAERMVRSKSSLIARMIGANVARRLVPNTPLAREMFEFRRRYRYIVEQTETLGQVQYFAYPWQRFHADWTGDGELEAYAARLEHYGLSSQPPAGWQPKDPRTLMLPEERDAYDRAQAAGQ